MALMLTPCLLSSGHLAACHMCHVLCSCTSLKKFKCVFSVEEEGCVGGWGVVLVWCLERGWSCSS